MNNHDRILLRYINALENSDFAVLAEIWQMAENDSRLTQDLRELNQEMGEPPMLHALSFKHPSRVHRETVPSSNGHQNTNHAKESWPAPFSKVSQRQAVRSNPLRRVAVVLIFIFGGLALFLTLQPQSDPVQTMPILGGTPDTNPQNGFMPITVDNADQLVEVRREGSGSISGALWTPDGTQIIAYGTYIWIYDADDLTKPLEVLDIPIFADFAGLGDDLNVLVIANKDGQALKVDLDTHETRSLPTMDNTVAFTRSRNIVARAQNEPALISVWDIAQNRELYVFRDFTEGINVVTFSPDGKLLIGAGTLYENHQSGLQSKVKLWDLVTGESTITLDLDPDYFISDIVMSSDGRFITATAEDGLIQWDLLNMANSLPTRIKFYSADIDISATYLTSLTLDANDKYLVVRSAPSLERLMLISLDTLELVYQVQVSLFPYTLNRSMAIHPTDNVLLMSDANQLRLVDGESLQAYSHTNELAQTYLGVDFYDTFMLSYSDSMVYVKDLQANEIVAQWGDETYMIADIPIDPRNKIVGAFFWADGQIGIYGNLSDNNMRQHLISWDYQSDVIEPIQLGDSNYSSMLFNEVLAIDYDPHSQQISYLDDSGLFIQFEDTNEFIQHMPLRVEFEFLDFPFSLAYHPNGCYVALAGWSRDIYIYDTQDRMDRSWHRVLKGHSDWVTDFSFSADGQWLYSVDRAGNLIQWNAETWQENLYGYLKQPFDNIASTPDGSLVALTSGTHLSLVSTKNMLVPFKTYIMQSAIADISFTPDGTQLVMLSEDGAIHFWGISEE